MPLDALRRRRDALNRPAAPAAAQSNLRASTAFPAAPAAPTFLGCGIHAAYDGHIVIVRLAAKSGDDQHLYLEPRVLRSLLLGAAEIGKRQAAEPTGSGR